jgi:hypothetical protein
MRLLILGIKNGCVSHCIEVNVILDYGNWFRRSYLNPLFQNASSPGFRGGGDSGRKVY